jgi:8-oxo-dGTP pyrophosphatase MutT (NUDIX family)
VSGHPKARHAATVVLLRSTEPEGFEVFMTRRPRGMEFLGGAYVFPGGGVRDEDCAEAILKRCHGLSRQEARSTLRTELSPELSLAYWVAGIRELFEEVGVLLCVAESGGPVDANQDGLRDRWSRKRRQMIDGSLAFLGLLESEGLLCNAASLRYFSHWRTPEEFATRFDTRFYLAALPAGQQPLSTSEEVAESLWLTPDRALKLCEEGKLPMIFPTFSALRTLADFDSLDSLFEEYRVG